MTTPKESRGFSNFGFSTILLSFVMICVVTFSALSLVTAYSDYKLSKKVAEKNHDYYKSSVLVYEKLAAIDRILSHCYLEASGETDYHNAAREQLQEYGTFETVPDATSEGYLLVLKEDISDAHYLSVRISIRYPIEASDTFYEIKEWKSIYATDAPEDETLNLIQ